MPLALRAILLAALATAVGVGVGIGIGAAIWEGECSPPPAASAPAAAASPAASASDAPPEYLFVVTADGGVVTATGADTLVILLRGTAPRALAFTDRPARRAAADATADLWADLYATGSAPPNAALAFEREGATVVLPVEMLNVTGAAPDYTIAARTLGEGGVEHLGAGMVQDGAAVVRGAGHPLWAEIEGGLEVEAPAMFIDDGGDFPCLRDGETCGQGIPGDCCSNQFWPFWDTCGVNPERGLLTCFPQRG
jgi:hypothetical protein